MAGITYPPSPATLTGDVVAVNRFLQNPVFVARTLQTLAQLRYVGTKLLKGRAQTNGGAIGYEQVQGIFADNDPKIVAPGSEYPLTITEDGPAQLARVTKRGEDAIITDEAIHRRLMDPVTRGMTKLVNSVGRQVDQIVISTIASVVTATRPAAGVWSNSPTANILQDLLLARADIANTNLGYSPDMLLVDDFTGAYIASNATIATAMARETMANPVYTGSLGRLAGLEIVTVPAENLPGGAANKSAWILDSNALGFIAFETLGGGYQAAGDLIESKVMRDDGEDSWRIRGRSNFVPAVTDPLAAVRISGVAA